MYITQNLFGGRFCFALEEIWVFPNYYFKNRQSNAEMVFIDSKYVSEDMFINTFNTLDSFQWEIVTFENDSCCNFYYKCRK